MVWNNRIGWKKSQKLIKVWGGIIVLGGKFLECYFCQEKKSFEKVRTKGAVLQKKSLFVEFSSLNFFIKKIKHF